MDFVRTRSSLPELCFLASHNPFYFLRIDSERFSKHKSSFHNEGVKRFYKDYCIAFTILFIITYGKYCLQFFQDYFIRISFIKTILITNFAVPMQYLRGVCIDHHQCNLWKALLFSGKMIEHSVPGRHTIQKRGPLFTRTSLLYMQSSLKKL
jgi:hypothetical protein